MSATGLEVFDTPLQKTNEWLDEVMDELAIEDRHAACAALRGTLHGLRDRLPLQETAQLSAQLPMLIEVFYYEGWRPVREFIKIHQREFLLLVEERLTGGAAMQLDS
jgi:uncharacterized protein (DUF2267 family)